MMYNEEEIVIDIKDVCFRLLIKWRTIFIVGIVSIFLGLGIGAFLNYSENRNKLEQMKAQEIVWENGETDFFDSYLTDMTDIELEQLSNILKQYAGYKEEYNATLDYIDNSLYMDMDSEHVLTYITQYYVALDKEVYTEVDYTLVSDITAEYATQIVKRADYSIMSKLTSLELENVYWKELISVQSNGSFLNVYVTAPSEKIAENLMQVLDETIMTYTNQLENYGQFTISVVAQDNYVQKNGTVEKIQKDTLSQLINYSNQMEEVSKDLNVKQTELFEALTESILIEKDMISLKSALIGCIAGVFLVCGYIVLHYIMSGCLQTDMDITTVYGLELIGNGCTRTKKKAFLSGIDEVILKVMMKDKLSQDVEMAQSNAEADIQIMMKQKGWDKLYLATTTTDESCVTLMKNIEASVTKDNVHVQSAEGVLCMTETLNNISEADCVVLVECVDVSARKDIARMKALCERYETPILGAVVLRKL